MEFIIRNVKMTTKTKQNSVSGILFRTKIHDDKNVWAFKDKEGNVHVVDESQVNQLTYEKFQWDLEVEVPLTEKGKEIWKDLTIHWGKLL